MSLAEITDELGADDGDLAEIQAYVRKSAEQLDQADVKLSQARNNAQPPRQFNTTAVVAGALLLWCGAAYLKSRGRRVPS